jgi:hypothetical protein
VAPLTVFLPFCKAFGSLRNDTSLEAFKKHLRKILKVIKVILKVLKSS